jgi:hypothetical protein
LFIDGWWTGGAVGGWSEVLLLEASFRQLAFTRQAIAHDT